MSSNHVAGPIIAIRDLRFRYPGMHHDALSMPRLEIDRPGLVAITGPSGAGKSTLIELMAGTLSERYTGSVQVLGKEWSDLRGDRSRQFHLRRIALIPQDLGLLPSQTPRQMLCQALLDADVPKAECDDRVLGALSRMDLDAYADRRIAEMSGGQKQRVAIARALVRNVELILADEPTANLNPQLADETIAILKRIGQTIPVVVVTHDPRIAELCDSQIRLAPPLTVPVAVLSPIRVPAAARFAAHPVSRMPAAARLAPAPLPMPAQPSVGTGWRTYRKLAVVSTAAACGVAAVVALLVAGLTSSSKQPIQTQTLTAVAPVEPSPSPTLSPSPRPQPSSAPATVTQTRIRTATAPRPTAKTIPQPSPTPVVQVTTPAPAATQATPVSVQPSPTPNPATSYLLWWQQIFGGSPTSSPSPKPTPVPTPTG